MKQRFVSILLAVILVLSLIPAMVNHIQVEADALSVSSLTCSAYISNATARSYIDTMMKYYITSNSTLQSTLNSGQPVVFMFEGGSDNYWTGSDYVNDVWDVRIQAAVFVVKLDSNGNAYVAFCSENCSSIPSYAPNCTAGVGYSGSVTILDGVYRMYRWDHTGPYAAFQLDIPNSNAGGYGLYVPNSVPDGQLLGCSGINVHTRSTTSGSYWSEGCQLIGTGNDSSNEFNAFFKAVTGINANPWLSWNPKNLQTWNGLGYYYGSGYTMGYFVVDRQLGMLGMDGTKYGTGSLNRIYNTTALGKLTSYSTKAAEAAGAFNQDYISANCTYYPSHCEISVTRDQAPVNSYPCSIGTTADNVTLEYAPAGSTYTVTGMFKNTYGNFWYRVITKGGKTGYIYGGEAYYVRELTSDITLSGASKPNGHVKGNVFSVNGTVSSQYNQLNNVSVWVRSGYGTSGGSVTGGSDSVSNNKYVLAGSDIDYATAFNELGTGRYTYDISVNYTNYYSEGASTLKENTKTISLCEEYFVVIPSSVNQSSCSHTYVTTNIGTGGCTSGITVVKSCTTCGYITKTQTTGAHSYGGWTTVSATCTTDGYKVRTCSVCGNQEKETYTATGHDYSMKVIPATCVSKVRYEYTCGNCGDCYSYSGDELAHTWLEEIPEGMDATLFETKTQYRYSDIETTTSYSSSLSGYTLKSSAWEQSGTGSVQYVLNWSTGFSTSNSLYSQYNKKSSKVSAYENETTKRVINSDAITGYLYFHWCAPGSFYSYEHSTGSYTIFHAYYSTTAPWNYDCDYNDMSYNTKSASCSNSTWYFVDEVYTQKYTDYKKLYTHERWGAYSDWSDTAVSASSTRQVQTRTLYRLKDTGFGDHSWNSGVITSKPTCTTDGVITYTCGTCGTSKTETVAMTGHSYSAVVTAPTCTDNGYTTHTCASCRDSYTDSYVDALGHSYGNWVQTLAPTCSKPGMEIQTCTCGDVQSREVAIIDHSYSTTVTAPTCTEAGYTTHTCINCGYSYQDSVVAALGHSWLDATCTQAKVCTVCTQQEGNALGHSYEAVVTAPDCLNGGYTTFTCSVCGDNYIGDRQPALGHSYEAVVTAPTCTTAGYTTYSCTVCGASFRDDHVSALGHSYEHMITKPTCTDNGFTTHTCATCGKSYQDTVVPALGHTWTDATCTAPKTCSVCGETEGEALGHSYEAVVTAPTCTEGGYTTYTCSACGDSYVADEVDALGHTWTDATCTDAKTCSVCGETDGEALGHSYEAVVTAPTCTAGGYTTYTCSACGDSYVADEVDALGHTWTDATCTAPKTCTLCGATEGEALGHGDLVYSFVDNTHTFTCTVCNEVVITKASTDGKQLKFRSAAPLLGDCINVEFGIEVPAGFENVYVVFDFIGKQTKVDSYYVNAAGRYVFEFPGINPQTIGENIRSTVYATVDGVEVSLTYATYSVRTYCGNQLTKTTVSAALKTLIADLLIFGEKTQIVQNYKTDELITSGMDLTPYASTFAPLGTEFNKQAMVGTANSNVGFKSVTLTLSGKMTIVVSLTADDISKYTFQAEVNGVVTTYQPEDLVYNATSGRYELSFDKMKASAFDDVITFSILENGVVTSKQLQYSVNTYIQKNQSVATGDMLALLQAIYNYGAAAKALNG